VKITINTRKTNPEITIQDDVARKFEITFEVKYGMGEDFAKQLRKVADEIEGK
jgi:hypothetical protein